VYSYLYTPAGEQRQAGPTGPGLQQIFSLSCLNGSNGLPTCYAAADALSGAGPVVISSTDGGATWGGMETYDDTGWMYSISCPDASRCWATGAGTTVGLVGTTDGGNSWSQVTSGGRRALRPRAAPRPGDCRRSADQPCPLGLAGARP
jgi:hypothetical protein